MPQSQQWLQGLHVNEKSNNLIGFVVAILLISIICAGIIYYYRGTSGKLESELDNIENINTEIASETRSLQTGLETHRDRIATVTGRITDSSERISDLYTDIGETAKSVDRAIEIIDECENIIEAIKTQR